MTTDAVPEETQSRPAPTQPIVARAGTYYRWTRYLMATILVCYGGWSIYDGFFSWPNWSITHPLEKPKSDMDISFNKALGIILPPMGILALVLSLRNSRGEYRLEDDVLNVPGHPPVPLDKIISADKQLWDRKGIVFIEYEVPGSPRGNFKLDDFVYEREPTDQIFELIEAALLQTPQPQAEAPVIAAPAPPPKATAAKVAAPPAGKPAPQKPAPAAPQAPAMLKAKTPPRPKL